MTVSELISALQKLPQDNTVSVCIRDIDTTGYIGATIVTSAQTDDHGNSYLDTEDALIYKSQIGDKIRDIVILGF